MAHSSPWRDGLWGRGRLGVLIVAGMVALTLGACRSGTGSTPEAAGRRFAAYRQCLEDHGATPRARGTDPVTGNTADAATFGAARRACRGLRPAGGLRGGGIDAGPRAAFRRCMADHGVTLPTAGLPATGPGPKASGGVARGGMLNGLDRNDPVVAKALESCRSLLVAPSTSSTTTR